jgi:hypothetical protein
MPKFVYVEAMLSDRYEKFNYTDAILEQAESSYKKCMEEFSDWCKIKKQDVIRGRSNEIFLQKENELKLFFSDSKKYNYSLFDNFGKITLPFTTKNMESPLKC